MARRVIVSFLFLGVLAASHVAAQAFSVSYLEGQVEVKAGSAWVELSIGDPVSLRASLRVGNHACVELITPSARITLSQAGTYALADLLAKSQSIRSSGAERVLTALLSNLVRGSSLNQSTALGARGVDQSGTDDSEWMSSDAQVFLQAGKDFIHGGDYMMAVTKLTKALDAATPGEAPEIRYYIAEAYSFDGDARNALVQLADLRPAAAETWAADFVLLKAKILVDTFAFEQAVQWMQEKGSSLATDAQRMPMYFFLCGLAYRGTGDQEKEKQCLSRVVSAEAGDDIGKAAAQLLANP